mgnify:CR=1 FL=1
MPLTEAKIYGILGTTSKKGVCPVKTNTFTTDPLTILASEPLYIRPRGGDKSSVRICLFVSTEDRALCFITDPFAPYFAYPEGKSGYGLAKLADTLRHKSPTLTLSASDGTPLCLISDVDQESQKVTIRLHERMEIFDAGGISMS